MSLSRRSFLSKAAAGAAAAGTLGLPQLMAARPALALPEGAPQTPFESSDKTRWTDHYAEMDFFDELVRNSPNTFLFEEIGRSDSVGQTRSGDEQMPINLMVFGTDDTGDIANPGSRPTVYILGSQHGNEPAGREACIELIRDLAWTDDEDLLELLSRTQVIITPTANPWGRQRNTRENGFTDINRDHLNLRTSEARAYADASNLFKPYMIVDHHEYGPSVPVLYDDDLLYLWPRNLNVDETLRAKAKEFCIDFIKADCEAAGYSADEYGLAKVGPNVGPVFLPAGMPTGVQTAGDWDDGIARNAAGLRNTMGILVESAVSARAYDSAETASNLFRRVESQRVVIDATLRFLSEQGEQARTIQMEAEDRRTLDGAEQGPVYFDGQDEPHPGTDPASVAPQTVDDPGASQYRIPAAALEQPEGAFGTLTGVVGLHDLAYAIEDGEAVFPMDQPRKNVIPLLLDSRAERSTVDGAPVY